MRILSEIPPDSQRFPKYFLAPRARLVFLKINYRLSEKTKSHQTNPSLRTIKTMKTIADSLEARAEMKKGLACLAQLLIQRCFGE